MTYQLVDGNTEGDYLGLAQIATTIDAETAVESYLASSYQPKKGGSIPSPRVANGLTVAPSTAAQLVEGGPTILAPTISAYLGMQQGVAQDPEDEPEVRAGLPAGVVPLAVGALVVFVVLPFLGTMFGGRRR